LSAMAAVHVGVVGAYDSTRGLGTVREGEIEHAFHCTAISDGTREIDAGTAVAFVLVPRHGGLFEARSVTKLVS
jgi:cold shock CspA family protein